MQKKVLSLKCLETDGLTLFLCNLLSDKVNFSEKIFDGFNAAQMAYYANIIITSNVMRCDHVHEWLRKISNNCDQHQMVSCPLSESQPIEHATADESNQLFIQIMRKHKPNKETIDVAIDEVKQWKQLKKGPDGYVYVCWNEFDWVYAETIECKHKKKSFLMSTARYVGREEVDLKHHSKGKRCKNHNETFHMNSPFDLRCYAGRLHGQRVTIAYITPFGDESKCHVAEHILIHTLKKMNVPLENIQIGCTVEDYIAGYNRANWFDVVSTMFDEFYYRIDF